MINEEVYIDCPALRLVAYLPHHVPRYHVWMSDPEMLAATESEPLTLAEEQENQQSWLHAMDKLTFIILAKTQSLPQQEEEGVYTPVRAEKSALISEAQRPTPALLSEPAQHALQSLESLPGAVVDVKKDYTHWEDTGDLDAQPVDHVPLLQRYAPAGIKALYACGDDASQREDAQYVMVGDCNLFLLDTESDEDEDANADCWCSNTAPSATEKKKKRSAKPHRRTFEVEVMIAEPTFRRRGLAEKASRLLMQYALSVLGATDFVAKILDSNDSSLKLFTEKLFFVEEKRVAVFHEVHLRRIIRTEEERARWRAECQAVLAGSVMGRLTTEAQAEMAVWAAP